MKIKKGRKELEKYFKSGKYVFHGTDNGKIKKFEPRQSYNIDKNGVRFKDGEPAVFASQSIEVTIFYAIFNNINIPMGSFSVRTINKVTSLSATKDKIEFFKKNKIKGYVYVFEKKFFHRRNVNPYTQEVVCEKEIYPIDIIEVSNDDMVVEIAEMQEIKVKNNS